MAIGPQELRKHVDKSKEYIAEIDYILQGNEVGLNEGLVYISAVVTGTLNQIEIESIEQTYKETGWDKVIVKNVEDLYGTTGEFIIKLWE